VNDRSLAEKRCRNCRRPAGPFINRPSTPFDRHSDFDRHRAMNPDLQVDPSTGLCGSCASMLESLGGGAKATPFSQHFACIEYTCERCRARNTWEEHLRYCDPTEYLVPAEPHLVPTEPWSNPPGSPAVSPTPRTPLTRAMRERIFRRDGHKCQMCGADGRSLGVQLVIDHKKPLKRGGTNEQDNLQTLCSKCNSKKGAKNTGYGDFSVDREEG